MALKAKNIYYPAFYRKPLLTSHLEAFPSHDWLLIFTVPLDPSRAVGWNLSMWPLTMTLLWAPSQHSSWVLRVSVPRERGRSFMASL